MSGRRGNSEGTIVRRADGRYAGAIAWKDDAGRSRRTWVYGRTRPEVRTKLKAMRDRLELGLAAIDARARLDEYAAAWIESTLAASDRKASTKSLYASLARSHIVASTLGGLTLDKIRPGNVEAWIVELRGKGKAASTVRQVYTVLRAILETAVRDGLLARNPAAAVKRPRVSPTEATYLTPPQVRALLTGALSSRYAPLFALLVNTGLRRGEALALHWRDVDLAAGALRVRGTLARVDGHLVVTETKTDKSRRTVPLSPTTVGILRDVRQRQRQEQLAAGSQWVRTPYVFTTELGEPCDPRNALRALHVAAGRAGLPGVGLHTLRHSAASVMLSHGVPLKVVSDVLGHASVSITGDVYGHVSPDVSRSALDVLSAALDA
jgi:integrase